MSINEGQDHRITDTTRFLLRGLGLFKLELSQYGFINAFLDDIEHEHHYENSVYLLFKPSELSVFEWFVDGEKARTHLVIEEYDYPNGYIVLVYKFPAEYMDDYRLFLQGKYSKFSQKYKDLFPLTNKTTSSRNLTKEEPSFYSHIFTRSEKMRDYWEGKLAVILAPDAEYWSSPTLSKEVLNIKDYE